jgi:hypothetical protein
MQNKKHFFLLGRICATPGALRALKLADAKLADYVRRHVAGDWSEMRGQDGAANWHAILYGCRVFSVYRLASGQKLWIITEYDRSVTTLLLPEEY